MAARLEDSLPDHPKIIAAGGRAAWLYTCGLVYAARYLTDGAIPVGQVPRLTAFDDNAALAETLVTVGLWERATDDEAFLIHDYCDYNPPRAAVLAERNVTRARVQRWRDQQEAQQAALPLGAAFTVQGHRPAPPPVATPKEPQPRRPGPPKAKAREPKPPRDEDWDALWDAMVEGIGVDPSSRSEKANHAACIDELAAIEPRPTPDLVVAVCRRYRLKWPNAVLSARAILGNWTRFAQMPDDVAGETRESRVLAEMARLYQAEHGGGIGVIDAQFTVREVAQ